MATAKTLNALLIIANDKIARRNDEMQHVSNLMRSLAYYRDSLAAGDDAQDCPAWEEVRNDWFAMVGRPDAKAIQDDLGPLVAGMDWEK